MSDVEQHKPTKAERQLEKGTRRKRERPRERPPAPPAAPEAPEANGRPVLPQGFESTLERIEDAAGAQASRTEQLLDYVTRATSLQHGAVEALKLRRENVIPIDQTLALICQAPRSGGTLLARLFDGHPQLHAHPHELHIGARRPHTWPDLGLDESPDVWFEKLSEDYVAGFFGRGRRVIPLKAPDRAHAEPGRHPFICPPKLQRAIFLDEVDRRSPIESERQILDCYMTSLFNGWLDNQNLYGADKRWVVAFSPRRAWGDGLDRYFDIYPEGRLISILRDPWSWYTSAQGRDPKAEIDVLLGVWKRSATEMLHASKEHADQFCAVRFDELILDTPKAMRRLAAFLDIENTPKLTTPTFNEFPVGANSSFETREVGVSKDPVDRYKDVLSDEQRAEISESCEALYEEALALTEREVG